MDASLRHPRLCEDAIMACVIRLSLLLTLGVATLQAQPADLVIRNGKIVTMESSVPEVQALAARGGKIIAVGTNQQMLAYIGSSTKVIDLSGRLAVPGFIEGHGHFTSPSPDSSKGTDISPVWALRRCRSICATSRIGIRLLPWSRPPHAKPSPEPGLSGAAGIKPNGIRRPLPTYKDSLYTTRSAKFLRTIRCG